jgi:ribosome-binding ATPase YchF (GTP1/OBG family)
MPSEEAKEWLEMRSALFRIQHHTHTANSRCFPAPVLPFQALRKRAAEENCEVVVVSAKVESELNGMPSEEAKEWLEMLGVEPGEGGGLGALIRATYKTLGLQTYFTTGGPYVLLLVLL